jgi:uncharacterized protein (TIGR02265 family)
VQTRVTSETALGGSVDPEERFGRFPADFALKGMFFSRLIELGEVHMTGARSRLVGPPRLGRYLPFSDYPQVDYSRLCHAVAVGRFAKLPVREAMRRLARLDYETFAESTLGRVSLAFTADADAAVLSLPRSFSAVLRGGTLTVTNVGPKAYDIRFTDFYGWVDCYPIGTIEGLLGLYGRTCAIELDLHTPISATYHLTIL